MFLLEESITLVEVTGDRMSDLFVCLGFAREDDKEGQLDRIDGGADAIGHRHVLVSDRQTIQKPHYCHQKG